MGLRRHPPQDEPSFINWEGEANAAAESTASAMEKCDSLRYPMAGDDDDPVFGRFAKPGALDAWKHEHGLDRPLADDASREAARLHRLAEMNETDTDAAARTADAHDRMREAS